MKRFLFFLFLLALTTFASADPLRVFIRGGVKTHGPNAHEHARFLQDWKKLLTERGMVVDGALGWPMAEQLAKTDVLVLYAQDGGNATDEQKKNLAEFTQRGGGLVVIHTAAVSDDPPWWKSVIGGAWVPGKTKWKEGPMDLYYTENQRLGGGHPITEGASNFHIDDEIYYDMDISPEAKILATSYTPNVPAGRKAAEGGAVNVYDIQPQMWTYEKPEYRAFVTIPGHLYSTFEKPFYRAILLRGIAWVGKRESVNEFCRDEELKALRYPEGGPQRPEDTLNALEIHPDFTLKLVAAEPLINKPMNFDWDPAGRLWVAETPEYPNGRRGMRPDYRGREWKDHGGIDPKPGRQDREAYDRISILTDTDGDGVMDKKQVFYEGLELVTGFVFYKDGVIVTQAPDILWLRDTDGDGVADKVDKIYTGLGTGDTHAVINNPRWGWDGWIYATHGYSAGRVKSGDGKKDFGNIGSGVVRFKPDGSAFEQYSSKGGNTWGLEITADNRVMWTQPTSGDLLMQTLLPEYALARGKLGNTPGFKVVEPSRKTFPAMTWQEQAYRQIDWVGSFTAAAGCVIYDGGSWPAEYNGDYFTTEPTINIVHHARLTPEGSSSTFHKLPGREQTEFIRSRDMWWRPIEVRVGPDGAVYIADFYNQAVIHNDTRGTDHNAVNAAVRPDRDHYFGRIWRLDHKDAKKLSVPDLSKADEAKLVAALDNSNRAVRATASRLLIEDYRENVSKYDSPAAVEHVDKLFAGSLAGRPETKIAALWTLQTAFGIGRAEIETAAKDADASVRRNAALIAEAAGYGPVATLLQDRDAGVRLAALRALGAAEKRSDEDAKSIIGAWPKLDDDFQKSAAIGAAVQNPAASIAAALESTNPAALTPLVARLAEAIGARNDAVAASELVITLAGKPASADPLKRVILDTLAKSLKNTPPLSPQLSVALAKLLTGGASGSALPLAVKWDKAGTLKPAIEQLTSDLFAQLQTGSDDERLAAVQGVLGLRSANPEALPAVLKLLAGPASPAFRRQLIATLGETGDPSVGPALAGVFAQLPAETQSAAYETLLKRADWTGALLDAAEAKKIDLLPLGPANLARLRTYPNPDIAARGGKVLDALLGPALAAKNETLTRLIPIIEQPGDAAKGRTLFSETCAICHKLGDTGADIGPALTGMGAHGPAELLAAIIDPNREVDPTFVAWNIETKDGGIHAGVIARENPTSLVLKSLAGQEEIRVADIKTRVNTGRSLMPEGFEALGGEKLRDLLAFICGPDAGKFRMLDLSKAFTATTARGTYNAPNDAPENFHFAKTGLLNFGGIPFNLIAPEKSPNGRNVIQLKGGPNNAYSRTMPQRVEIPTGGFRANRLHFLGNVAGWGFPYSRDTDVVLKATVQFTDGTAEVLEFRNGVDIADYISRNDVTGSKFAEGITKNAQVRWNSRTLEATRPIEKIVLESTGGLVAPTTFAITAELSVDNPPTAITSSAIPNPIFSTRPAPPTDEAAAREALNAPVPEPPATRPEAGPRVLLVGGGSSHDFAKFFGASDKTTLTPAVGWVDFTQNLNGIGPVLKNVDVVVLSANQPISVATREALMNYANAGGGLVVLHAGGWYGWNYFPQWNREIVGGGTKSHDPLGPFTVTTTNGASPITKGVPVKFEITDELYNYVPDPEGTPIEVLAAATSPKTGKTFPQVFIVKHPKARIIGITLGHDAQAHDHPAYQSLLKNAVNWAGAK